jgi:phosphoribosylaminoimidazole (AIR) synthetase
LKPVRALLEKKIIKGMAHITGGGFIDNIPRILPEGLGARIERIWPVPDIFNYLVSAGKIDFYERYRVFNMGIGMVLIIGRESLRKCEELLNGLKEDYFLIGQIEKNDRSGERVRIS